MRMISPGNLLTIRYQLTKSEATSCNDFRDASLFRVFYVLTKFESPSCYIFEISRLQN